MVTSGGSQYRVIEDGNLLKEIFVDNNLIETSVEIYSLLNGQQIMSFTCLTPNDNVDLSSIPKGVFLVRFQSEKNEGTLKLLKQ
ncbi:T9SS type A sorting domain-containing protein [Imperialibacter roseus]|uniref:T9SS type A sorting domain-containing protein n=1 Tax=Imperialibacter roseus TaxID=1324217 RepID=A0ABZ0IMZ0_9BACT|nr:T9SS type A sorting domain-containing protein [Imperialibacter roseus]WOK06407.1 T9SS type A sorting domain-containing protein [Imperialibacter roseus]